MNEGAVGNLDVGCTSQLRDTGRRRRRGAGGDVASGGFLPPSLRLLVLSRSPVSVCVYSVRVFVGAGTLSRTLCLLVLSSRFLCMYVFVCVKREDI